MATQTLTLEIPRLQKIPAPRWPFVMYALTGFTGVLAEQGFEKYITLLVGATASATAVVIFSYFLGFALGASAVAACERRGMIRRPLRLYGLLELLVGVMCLVFSYTFHPLTAYLSPLQGAVSGPVGRLAIRFAFGSTLMLPAAALMGASFPLIAKAVDPENSLGGKRWIQAYACNLGGAVVAALAGAYFVLPAIGIRGSFWACFVIGALVFLFTLVLPEQRAALERQTDERMEAGSLENRNLAWLLLAAAFGSGLAFFALEVIWTHLIATTTGSSVYAFASMLAMVLLGLLTGALRSRRAQQADRPITYSRVFQFSALLLVVQFRLWDYSQIAYLVELPAWAKNFYTIEAFKLALAALLIIPPAALLGTVYPLLLRNPLLYHRRNSFLIGYLNTANSIGCLGGALLGIFFLIPVVGSEWSLKSIVIALIVVGLGFLYYEDQSRKALGKAVFGSALVVLYACSWHWNHALMTSGINVYFGRANIVGKPNAGPGPTQSIIFFEEEAQGGMTTVVDLVSKTARHRVLLTNGKFEGTDDFEGQGFAQIGVGAVPSQFVGGFDRALLIGLGTGHSAYALEHLGYRQIDVAEFAPGIIHAAGACFRELNHDVLTKSNVRVVLEDGRNLLLRSPDRTYDVIAIELASIWFAGATNLYSQEFYKLAQSKLRDHGVLEQWVQLHHISPREVSSVIATIRSVFPYVSFWWVGEQGMIIATQEPQILNLERRRYLSEKLRTMEGVPAADRERLPREMSDSEVLAADGVDRLVAGAHAVINSDHSRWLEYATPRYNWMDVDWMARNLEYLRNFAAR